MLRFHVDASDGGFLKRQNLVSTGVARGYRGCEPPGRELKYFGGRGL